MLWKSLVSELRRLTGASSAIPPPAGIERRPGSWHHADLAWLAGLAAGAAGDFAEIGVFRGAAFRKVAQLAHDQGRMAHAFDSFAGMADPGAQDGNQYARGMFDVGGPEAFAKMMDGQAVQRAWYRTWPGYIPACFAGVPQSLRFSLAILDVDHYEPTASALAWLAPRLSAGGILALDDYLEAYSMLATRAIKEFLAGKPPFDIIAQFNQHLILKRR
jgi:hypothetical protein